MENAQNTCPWPFMVPVMGLMTFALSNQRHAWLPCHFMSFKTVFSHAKTLSAMRWCIGQAVIELWMLWSTFGSINRSVTRSLRQLQVQPLCRSAVRDIAALPTAFLSFAWRCLYLAHWLLMMSRWQWRFSDYWYKFGVKGRGQVYLKPVLQLVTRSSIIFDGRCSYLEH